MASQPDADITIGTVISATMNVLRDNLQAVAFFVGVFTVAGSVADYATSSAGSETYGVLGGLWQMSVGIASILGMYLLIEAMLKDAGLMSYEGSRRFPAYFGQAIIIGFGVAFGLLFLIVPGLILAARWSVAQPILVGQGRGVFAAMSDSWELTRGHTVTIIIAAIVLFALAIVAGVLFTLSMSEESLVGIILSQLVSNGVSAASLAFTVALYGLLSPAGREIGNIFT